jgi:acetyl-CoA C-acetyltransferase
MCPSPVYILGGYQTDFSRNYTREGKGLVDLFQDSVRGAMDSARIDPTEIDVAHVGNFIGELTNYQGHLGAMFLEVDPAFSGLPTSRHEAACASGSIALLAAKSEIEAGHYECACVVGVEMERGIPGDTTAAHLGVAAWHARECEGVKYPWPLLFSRLGDEYDKRYGINAEHLAAIARNNFANAKDNPNAQTRQWEFTAASFAPDDQANPVIEGRIRRQDCSQVTDGAVAVFLASEKFAKAYARTRGKSIDSIPRILGWGHHTAPFLYEDKIRESAGQPYIFPHVRATFLDALKRAALPGPESLDAIEVHDCFTTTEYMAIDHIGLTPPGQSWRAIEDGSIERTGRLPINASGGLMGVGHPVGASGVRMLLDGFKQVTGSAGGYQIPDARRAATLNIGGSGTTSVSFIVGVEEADRSSGSAT